MDSTTLAAGRQHEPTKLQRETFVTSREMDFFSEKELTTQTGHDVSEWPLVIVKELIDNALCLRRNRRCADHRSRSRRSRDHRCRQRARSARVHVDGSARL